MSDKLLAKIWESVVDKGIGGLLLPWQIKRVGKANADVRRHDALMAIEIERQIAGLQNGEISYEARSGKFLPRPNAQREELESYTVEHAVATLPVRIQDKLAIEILRREVNLVLALHVAAEEAEQISEAKPGHDKPIERDWVQRWREGAETVTSEEVRQLWGRILAGEVNKPGTFSLRTLSLLSNISTSDARRVELLGPLVIDGAWIAHVLPMVGGTGITLQDLLILDEMGLLANTALSRGVMMTLGSSKRNEFEALLNLPGGKGVAFRSSKVGLTISIPAIHLTHSGKQIISLGRFDANIDYVKEVAKAVKREGLKVFLGNVERDANGNPLFTQVEDVTG